eukprot:augustus_masked-scaffold_28-processed-gene-4.113-mRNA-1 protein AED:1.00 eAED:1.00 QI:0/0/0/0/1/1/2/0/473
MEQEKDNSKEVGSQKEPEEATDALGQGKLGRDADNSADENLATHSKTTSSFSTLSKLTTVQSLSPSFTNITKTVSTRSPALGALPFSTLGEVTRIRREARKLETQKAALEDMQSGLLRMEEKQLSEAIERQSVLDQRELELISREKSIDDLLPGQLEAKKQQNNQFKKLSEWQDRLTAKELELPTTEQKIKSSVQESNQATESAVDKKPLETPVDRTPSIPDKLSQFNEPTPSNQLPEDMNKDQKSVRSLSVYEKWSKTGNSYVDRDKYKKRYQFSIPPAYPTSNMNRGFPLVQVQLSSKLKQLTGKGIENFLNEYRNTVRKVPALSVQTLLSKNVADALEQREVELDSSEAIRHYLTRHLLNFGKSKRLKSPASESGIRFENISDNFIINKVDAVPLSVIKDNYTEHVDNLGQNKPIPPIIIFNMVDNTSEEFNEVDIEEGNISKKEELGSLRSTISTKVSESTIKMSRRRP